MTDEVQRWKEKYLKSIEQQDKLEMRWNARLDLLRRGLVRSSLAAEGADKAVDQCMKEMREIVRKDDMDAGLSALIPRLEKAVLDSEQRREQRIEQMGAALTSLAAQLQSLPLPREVAKPLKRFAKNLEGRVTQARELPLLLSELSGLQGQALSHIEHSEQAARPGFLERLFGGRDENERIQPPGIQSDSEPPKPVSANVDSQCDELIEAAPQTLESGPWANDALTTATINQVIETPVTLAFAGSDQGEPEAAEADLASVLPPPAFLEPGSEAQDGEERAIDQAEALAEQDADYEEVKAENEDHEQALEAGDGEADGPYALPATPEPSYSSVAAHIEETLLGLLNDLTLPEHHRPQAEAMRVRLEHGLNWYELLPILDDLAVLMLAITNSGQHEFELYLEQLNQRLESFQSNLQAASENHAGQQSASQKLSDQLREHVGDLQSSVHQAADLDSLKRVLESRLEGLLGTLDEHQKQRDQREQEVASRLQLLASRVATMDQEALGFRAHLEEQRQKALTDTLTGLPNRAAWSEHLDREIEQMNKHRSSLLLGILDLDHFKRINDGYGHLAGDKVLKIIATQLKKRLRPSDFMARFGGEEFVFLLARTPMVEGLALLERLRVAIEECPFHFKGEPVTITVSMGITTFSPGERSDLVLKRADQALYRAKGEGRNRIEQG